MTGWMLAIGLTLLRIAFWSVWIVGALAVISHLHWFLADLIDRRTETKLVDHWMRAKMELDRRHER